MRLLVTFFAFLLSAALYGQNEYSLDFSNSNIELPSDLLSDLNGFTFSAYFFADPTQDGYSNIVQQDPGVDASFFIRYENNLSDFKYSFKCGSSTHLSIAASSGSFSIPSINSWHHVAMTYDGITATAYLDGVIVGYETFTGSLSYFHSVPMYIGNWQMQEDFNGNIDEVHIWNSALSQEQIQQYMTCPPSGDEEGLVGYWNFEEGSGTTAYDQTTNGNNGTINGATWSTDTPEQNCQSGCTDSTACNYNPNADYDDGSCEYFTCKCLNGTLWSEELEGCIVANPTDTNLDGCTDLNDLMDILAAYGICAFAEFASCGDLLEYQGYDYETLQIGEQCWFAENLRAENYTDGTSIPLNSIENPVSGPNPNYKCFYGDDLSNVAENGMLYSWFASADSRGICPVGWHLPSLNDFEALTQEVGGVSNAGSALKAVPPTWNGNDDYGFTAIPSGYFNWVNAPYSSDPGYFFMGSYAYYWSSESTGSNSAYYMILWSDQNSASLLPSNGNFAEDAMSVRCIKD